MVVKLSLMICHQTKIWCEFMPSSSEATQFEDEDDLEEVVKQAPSFQKALGPSRKKRNKVVHGLRSVPWSVRLWSCCSV